MRYFIQFYDICSSCKELQTYYGQPLVINTNKPKRKNVMWETLFKKGFENLSQDEYDFFKDEKQRRSKDGKCCVSSCDYDQTYNSPADFCDWHWALWFCYGDETLAKEDIIRLRQTKKDLKDHGRQIKFDKK